MVTVTFRETSSARTINHWYCWC